MNLLKYGAPGAAGLLVGIAVVIWAGPETGPGVTLILIVCVLAAIVLREAFRLVTGK